MNNIYKFQEKQRTFLSSLIHSLHFTHFTSLHFTSLHNQKERGRHVLKAGSTEGWGAHGLNVHGFRISRFAASHGCAAHGELRACFGLEILLKIKPNEKYENLKFCENL